MTTKLNSASLDHVRVLAAHGARIVADHGDVALTPEICEKALTWLSRTPAAVSLQYDLLLPELAGPFVLVINRDGTVESGSAATVDAVLQYR